MQTRPSPLPTDADPAAIAALAALGFSDQRVWIAIEPAPAVPAETTPTQRELLESYGRGKLRTSWVHADGQVLAAHERCRADPGLEFVTLLLDGTVVATETVSARDRAGFDVLPPHDYALFVDTAPADLLEAHRAHVADTVARSGARPCRLGPDDYGIVASYRSADWQRRASRALSLGLFFAVVSTSIPGLALTVPWARGAVGLGTVTLAWATGLVWMVVLLAGAGDLPRRLAAIDGWMAPSRPGARAVLGREPDLGQVRDVGAPADGPSTAG